jgi:hypothetical protein
LWNLVLRLVVVSPADHATGLNRDFRVVFFAFVRHVFADYAATRRIALLSRMIALLLLVDRAF